MKKKNLMFVCACLLMSHAVSAQSKGEEIQFHRHGSLQLQGGAAYTLGEAGFGDLVSPAVGVHGSYYFTPVWGLRAGVSGYESKRMLAPIPPRPTGLNWRSRHKYSNV